MSFHNQVIDDFWVLDHWQKLVPFCLQNGLHLFQHMVGSNFEAA